MKYYTSAKIVCYAWFTGQTQYIEFYHFHFPTFFSRHAFLCAFCPVGEICGKTAVFRKIKNPDDFSTPPGCIKLSTVSTDLSTGFLISSRFYGQKPSFTMYKVMNKQPFPHPVENFCGKAEKYALKGVDYKFDEKNNFPKNKIKKLTKKKRKKMCF